MSVDRVEIGPHVLYCGDCLEILPPRSRSRSYPSTPPRANRNLTYPPNPPECT